MPGFHCSDLRLKQGQKLILSPVLLVAFLEINISGAEKHWAFILSHTSVYVCLRDIERQTDRQEGGGRLRFCISH